MAFGIRSRRLLAGCGVLAVSLTFVGGATAKQIEKTLVVGANGASFTVRGDTRRVGDWRYADAEATSGRYYLLYPLMDGFPVQPGRYYPASQAACFSWNRRAVGECIRVDAALAGRLAPRAGVTTFAGEPTTLVRLAVGRRRQNARDNYAVAVELAFNGWRRARTMRREPSLCVPVNAWWRGPQAARRPTRFCVGEPGIWHAGRLYPAPKQLYMRFEEIHWPFGPPYPG